MKKKKMKKEKYNTVLYDLNISLHKTIEKEFKVLQG